MLLQESVRIQACIVYGETRSIVDQHFLATPL
jgi:hypothetical protein